MLIDKIAIENSILKAKENDAFSQLNTIYSSISDGICSGCTKCCMESVNTFYIEFLNIYCYLNDNEELKNSIMQRLRNYYFLELVKKMPCPFLNEENKCDIYYVRPLTCRLFGHWDRKDFEKNISIVLDENKISSDFIKEKYNLTLPNEVVSFTIPYCESFEVNEKLNEQTRLKLNDDIFGLDILFLMNQMLPEDLIGTNLVSWFIYTQYDKEKAGELRLQIMTEFLKQGKSTILTQIE